MDGSPNIAVEQAGARLKVMILALEYTPEESGGVGTHAFELARGLSCAGCRVTVLAYTSGEPTTIRAPNLTVYLIAPSTANAAQLSIVQGILAFNADLVARASAVIAGDDQRPDIIQYYNWITFPAASQLRQLFQIAIAGVIQYISEPIERWWGQTPDEEIVQQEALLFRQAEVLICASRSLRDVIQATYGVPADRMHVVHNGMDVRAFTHSTFTAEQIGNLRRTIAKSGEKIVVFAGRLNPQKGIAALIAAAARVIAQYPHVRYLLAGAPDSQQFTQVVRELLDQHAGVQPKIKLLGKVPRKQLAWLYQVADVAVVPSVYEPFGYVAIEAMAAGVPVVATDVGGLAEIVLHDQTGLLIPVDARATGLHMVDVERLAAAQVALLTDEALAQRLGAAGRQRVAAEFNADKMTRAIIDVYQHTIAHV